MRYLEKIPTLFLAFWRKRSILASLGRVAFMLCVCAMLFLMTCCTVFRMPGKSFEGPAPALTGAESQTRDNLIAHTHQFVEVIGHRDWRHPENLNASVEYIEKTLCASGYEPGRVTFTVDNAEGVEFVNIEAEKPGTDPNAPVIVVGAHYDSYIQTRGANDNISGVAATLELARLMRNVETVNTVRFVLFVNEEPPFFTTVDMGSLVYARHCKERGDKIACAIVFDMIGYYSDEPGSQQYPPFIGLFFPEAGNFLAFVGNRKSGDWVRKTIGGFRKTATIPSEGAILPEALSGVAWSDHWSFWQCGWPGILLTDTAPYRYAYYHTPEDTPDKLDYEGISRIAHGMVGALAELAGGDR